MAQYEEKIGSTLLDEKSFGAKAVSSGDIFIDKRRMSSVKAVGMQGCFPLYGTDTANHMGEIIDLGLKACVVCVNAAVLDQYLCQLRGRQRFSEPPSSECRPV
jgi:diphthamide synthase (EF-2-diphthine--ammonia ligase)